MSFSMSDRIVEIGMLVGYLGLLLWIGIRTARRVQTASDFTVAGRSVPWVVVMATTAATMIGGGASVGYVAQVHQIGIAAAVVTIAWHVQLVFTGLFVAPRLRGLNLVTVGDYFHLKFGPLAREMAVFNCIIFLVGALAAQMAAIGHVTHSILGLDYATALWIGAVVTIIYSTIGGMRAVIATDVLQFAILVFGIGLASAFAFYTTGGFSGLETAAQSGQFELTSHRSLLRTGSLFIAFLLGETFVPPYAVRCFIARDAQQARWGVAGAGLFLLLFLPTATLVLGTAAQVDPRVQQELERETDELLTQAQTNGVSLSRPEARQQANQSALPTLVRTTLHPLFAGLLIAAIIAAVMSSADSCLSCLATVMMEDYYRRHLAPQATDPACLRVARMTTLICGFAAAICAWYFSNIASILEFVYDFWAPTMVLPFAVGLFWYHPRRVPAVIVAMATGFLTALGWRMGSQAFAQVNWFKIRLEWTADLSPAVVGFVACLTAYFVAVLVTGNNSTGTRWFQPDNTSTST